MKKRIISLLSIKEVKMKGKNLKMRLLALTSSLLLLSANTVQAVDWSSWAAQIATNKELMYSALAAGAVGGAALL